jgi:hypothetical protein
LEEHFHVKKLGDVSDLLGVQVTRDRATRSLTLSQETYARQLVQKAGMSECKPVDTPVTTSMRWTKADCPNGQERIDLEEEATWYRKMSASLIFLAMWTRPDLAFAVSRLCKYMANPGRVHITALKRTLRYVKGTASRCLRYAFNRPPPRKGVYGYFDAAHADDLDTRRSTMAYLFFVDGALISWKSKLHTYVTTSTNHSEYVASSKAAREAKWLHKIFTAMGFRASVSPIALFGDNAGSISMNYNPVQHEANKHVELADHYAREQVEQGVITITHVPTAEMLADALTKALPKSKFVPLISSFMIMS